jgi:hypothetical protein
MYINPRFGKLCKEKSGNPARVCRNLLTQLMECKLSKGRRNGFFECRIESYRKANVKLVISQIRIVM